MHQHQPTSSNEALAERLGRHGLRATAARIAVLRAMQQARRQVSHADLEPLLAAHSLDRVTLYRTLESLAKAGLALKTVGDDRVMRFVLVAEGEHGKHAHFHCDDCGRVYCLPARAPRSASALPDGFVLETAELTYHGHCAECTAEHG